MRQISNVLLIGCLVLELVLTVGAVNDKLQEKFSWKLVDFKFPNDNARNEAISSGRFIPQNNLPLGLEVWRNKLFITLPRWKEGIAATLTYVNLNDSNKSPLLIPYPNWSAHELHKKTNVPKITSVFRLNVDACDRLWLLDDGVVDIFGKAARSHPPKIQIYNLTDDALLKEYTLPGSVLRTDSFAANILVDVSADACDKAYAYVADLGAYALIVYNLAENDSYRVSHHYFHFDPLAGDYNIGGINFQWHDGIFGLALSPKNHLQDDGYRTLYFHPMSSMREFAVSTKVIQNKTAASDSYHEFKVLGSRGPNGQASASSIDQNERVLFYTLLNKDAIGCWNIENDEYSVDTNTIVASDSETMIFPNDLKVDKTGNVWVLTDRLPTMLYSTLNFSDVNYRIFSAPVSEIIKGTVCERKPKTSTA